MDAPKTQLLSHLTRSLLPEQQAQAEGVLREVVKDEPVAVHRRTFKALQWLVWVSVAAAMVLVFKPLTERVFRSGESINLFGIASFNMPEPVLPKGATEEDRQILGGFETNAIELKRQLHLSDPRNPSYFAEYAISYVDEHHELPPGYVETVQEIDPDNAFFYYLAAGTTGRDCLDEETLPLDREVERDEHGLRLALPPRPKSFTITDPDQYAEALGYIEQAKGLPEYRTYDHERIRKATRVLDKLDARNTLPELMRSLYLVLGYSTAALQNMKVSKLIAASAEQASQSGDQAAFQKWLDAREQFIDHLSANEEPMLIDALVFKAVCGKAINMAHYGRQLELDALADGYQEVSERFYQARLRADEARRNRSFDLDGFYYRHSGMLHSVTLPAVSAKSEDQILLTPEHFRPMREAEHDFAAGIFARITAVLFLAMAGAALLFRRCLPRTIRKSAAKCATLLTIRDWLILATLGVIAPIALHLVLSRHTPLGGREFGVQLLLFVYPGVLMLAALVFTTLLTVVLVQHRLRKRLPMADPQARPSRLPLVLLMLVALVLLVVFTGLPLLMDGDRLRRLPPWVMCLYYVPPVILLFGAVASIVFAIRGNARMRFSLAATTSVLPTLFVIAALAMSLTTMAYKQGEIHWLAQDQTVRVNPDDPDLGMYEIKVARQLDEETRALLNTGNP